MGRGLLPIVSGAVVVFVVRLLLRSRQWLLGSEGRRLLHSVHGAKRVGAIMKLFENGGSMRRERRLGLKGLRQGGEVLGHRRRWGRSRGRDRLGGLRRRSGRRSAAGGQENGGGAVSGEEALRVDKLFPLLRVGERLHLLRLGLRIFSISEVLFRVNSARYLLLQRLHLLRLETELDHDVVHHSAHGGDRL